MLKGYNDGKGRQQSYEVWSDVDGLSEIGRGYGATWGEAYENYKKNVTSFVGLLKTHMDMQVLADKVIIEEVGCMGTPLKKYYDIVNK